MPHCSTHARIGLHIHSQEVALGERLIAAALERIADCHATCHKVVTQCRLLACLVQLGKLSS